MPEKPYFIQISDTHLFEDPAAQLWDVAPDPMLDRVVGRLRVATPEPEFIVVTGDCSNDGSLASYVRLERKLQRLGAPIYYLPGNHDDPQVMAQRFGGDVVAKPQKLVNAFAAAGWRLLLLDTVVPGQDGGSIGTAQRDWLKDMLAREPGVPTIVAMHHNPLPVGSAWLDTMTIDDAGELLAILDGAPQVKSVLFGHVHQEFKAARNGTAYLSAPSTFFQFKPRCDEFVADTERAPGARIISLAQPEPKTSLFRLA